MTGRSSGNRKAQRYLTIGNTIVRDLYALVVSRLKMGRKVTSWEIVYTFRGYDESLGNPAPWLSVREPTRSGVCTLIGGPWVVSRCSHWVDFGDEIMNSAT